MSFFLFLHASVCNNRRMNEFEVSKIILLKLVNNEMPFTIALKSTFKKVNVSSLERSNITALVGCELRHHYLFDNLIERYFDVQEFEKTVYLRFALANQLFLKRFDGAKILALAEQDLDKDKIKALFDFVKSTDQIIPNELDKASPEFLALRYNTPAWVIRMWQKQYGKGAIFKTLKVNYRPSVPSLRINEKKINRDEFLAKHPDYSASPIDNMIIYQGRNSPKQLEEYDTYDIFFMKMATKYVLDNLELDPLKGIGVFSEVPNNIYLDLLTRFGSTLKLDYVINHSSCFIETKRNLEKMGNPPHVFLYESNASGLIACLSNKVHTFIAMPKSTTFDLLRSTPDYFLRIKQSQLDEIIALETAALEESSKFVEKGGELVYMVPTLNRKESNNIIANFLVNHKEYQLEEERQFFPFEVYDSCLYFARMKKVEEESD